MPVKDKLFHTGHRERLKEKFRNEQLADYEKLELLLTYAIPRRDVRPLARRLIEKFGGIYFVLRAPLDELRNVDGVGDSTAMLIKLFYELTTVSYQERAMKGKFFEDDKFLYDYCRHIVANKTIEEFHVLYLGSDKRLLRDETHSRGTIDQAAAYPREIVKKAMELNAISIIMLHNHPLSEHSFSADDLALTAQVEAALQTIGVQMVDHLVVCANGIIHSYRASPWIRKTLLNL